VGQPANIHHLPATFEQIEGILGFSLPATARRETAVVGERSDPAFSRKGMAGCRISNKTGKYPQRDRHIRAKLYLGLVIYESGRAGVNFVRRGTIPRECLDYSSKLSDDTGTAERAQRNPASPIGKAFAFGPE